MAGYRDLSSSEWGTVSSRDGIAVGDRVHVFNGTDELDIDGIVIAINHHRSWPFAVMLEGYQQPNFYSARELILLPPQPEEVEEWIRRA